VNGTTLTVTRTRITDEDAGWDYLKLDIPDLTSTAYDAPILVSMASKLLKMSRKKSFIRPLLSSRKMLSGVATPWYG